MAASKNTNWFEKNPKKTIFILIAMVLIIMTYCTEKVLSYRSKGVGFNFALANRAITLREFRPLMIEKMHPDKADEPFDTVVKKDYLLRVDDNGFIMPSKRYDNPDFSIVFLGASTTACLYVDEECRFTYLTGVLLEKDLGIRINSYNASRTANHSLHSIDVLLNKIIPIKPNIVLFMHNNNDFVTMLYEKSYWNNSPTRYLLFDINNDIVRNFLRIMRDRYIPNLSKEIRNIKSNIKDFINSNGKAGATDNQGDEFAHMRGKKITFDKAAMVEEFEMNLQTFITICKIRKFTPVLMTEAGRFKENPDEAIRNRFKKCIVSYQEYRDLFNTFNDSIRKKARENDILVIDLAKKIPPEKEYIYDIIHYNNQGSRAAAKIISAELQPLVIQLRNGSRP